MNYDDANNIVHNINLERALLQKGVSIEHIAYLREKKPKRFKEYNDYYEYISLNDKGNVLVDTKKIIGIPRANVNASLYDNAAGKCMSKLNVYNMATAIKHICDDTLEQLYIWYEKSLCPVDLIYYSDEDVYAVDSEGNHRSLYANIVGVPFIRANVAFYKRNEDKYNIFMCFNEICDKYGVESIETDYYSHDVEVVFYYKKEKYVVKGYTSPRKDGIFCMKKINILAEQLEEDSRYIKDTRLIDILGKHRMIANMFFRFFIKDSTQAYRLYQHIHRRKKLLF